ncbi:MULTISPECIES: DUF1223 domain-containing protein [Croceitalea]|uniref:DUF1223 domain-containing protein n=1 Tax=Croceitalea vernalis TaxID=3075599 RepID=A0ABU3BKG2_9FLAO|nr:MULTISPECIES: DUF1223 domain-containing protein [unclassified Croceitalea]MDT0540949.1 DUF1223 domain-containing protein [Croceitalea sp. P059]MDT0622637.1 DUF1223 domain-containing protein [Croceitalea sp. P007]
MYKKIIIPIVVLVGLATMAFYQNKDEATIAKEPNNIDEFESIVVLELFTSQGCSSCPPADVLLEKAKDDFPDKVFALSYHVDYWNYIGWNDPYSKSAYTLKQRAYNQKFKSRNNYTPQMVINGSEHFVGSDRLTLNSKIATYGKQPAMNRVLVSKIERTDSFIKFDFEIEGKLTGKKLRTVLVLNNRITSVKRGENKNRTLKNSNIVIAENYLDIKTALDAGSINIPSDISINEEVTLMLILEDENLNITGAVKAKI